MSEKCTYYNLNKEMAEVSCKRKKYSCIIIKNSVANHLFVYSIPTTEIIIINSMIRTISKSRSKYSMRTFDLNEYFGLNIKISYTNYVIFIKLI